MEKCPNSEPGFSNVTLAMLAGGLGRRMGIPKAWLRIENDSILTWLHRRLNWPGPTMLVTAPATAHPPDAGVFDQHCIDPVSDLGPLRGILTALENSRTDLLMVVTVDMPLIDRSMLARLVSTLQADSQLLGAMCRAMTTRSTHAVQPFPSIYRRDARVLIAERLDCGQRSVQALFDDTRFRTIDSPASWPDEIWTNLNDPTQFATFEARLRTSAKESNEV